MEFLSVLDTLIEKRSLEAKEESYTWRLLQKEGLVERKLNEEAFEVIEASFKGERKELIYEGADLLYHLVVLLRKKGISLREIVEELEKR